MGEDRWGIRKRRRAGDDTTEKVEPVTRASLAAEACVDELASFILAEEPEGQGALSPIADWVAKASEVRAGTSEGVDIESLATASEAEESWSGASVAQMVGKRVAESAAGLPKVSILVPVYNAEAFLGECLDSLVTQTLGSIEIICIDDGSTDSSPQILAQYAREDERIRVLSKPNTGYGDSMNRGLSLASGEYIGICEPDDFADSRMFEMLYRTAKHNGADIAKANYCRHEQGVAFDPVKPILEGFDVNKPFDPVERPEVLLIEPSIWSGICRRGLIIDNGIAFTPSPGASYQDSSFAQQCWIAAKRVVFLKGAYLHYRIDNQDSSSNAGDRVFAICDEYDHTFSFLRNRGEDFLLYFGPWLNVMRQGQYIWNYNRIAPGDRLAFAERWLADVRAAESEGLLGEDKMTAGYKKLLAELREGPEAFVKRYQREIEYPPIK